MESTNTNSLFNNPLFSDITIRQTKDGVTKEYKAHKAILCAHSKWFWKALTGNHKEASSRKIEIHEDDPINFEIMLKYLYTTEVEIPDKCTWDQDPDFQHYYGAIIGVYNLADKYDCENLRGVMVGLFPQPQWKRKPPYNILTNVCLKTCEKIVESYYPFCAKANSTMGRAITRKIRQDSHGCTADDEFEELLIKYPDFAVDMMLVCRRMDGKLWGK